MEAPASPESPLNLTQCVPEDQESAPSCSSQSGSVESVSKITFLQAKIEWQEKMILDLEEERKFLREQLMRDNKTTSQRKHTKTKQDYYSDTEIPSSPNMSESDSDGTVLKKKKIRQSYDSSDEVAVLGRTHMRVKTPDEAIQRYKQVLKTFQRNSALWILSPTRP
uniref:Uncharacterized protein n=1 Tax=Knipowitschia caucasica TaxID=637954 RepID=A0AAV2LBY2_KNICA